MIDFYNAFISYRHAPLDSKVAEHVQRSLEHFRIPSAIQKKTGKKKIERIFRDKDELPITSDLTDTISNALEKAEYLIVICSPNTKESVWVQREIEFFLKNHSKDKILTVLADGEPDDVIPDILKTDEKTITDELFNDKKITVCIEPLSCDYRMPLKKAKKEEIPRLAAAVIGCSYDELVRRQRQYRARQMIIAGSLVTAGALGLAAYMTVSKRKIDKALEESLRNESKFLALQSQSLLEDNKRVEALYVAMAALPSDENDPRPFTAEAEAALSNAVYAYRASDMQHATLMWNYTAGSLIMNYEVSPSGTRLAVCENTGVVDVWDTETHEQLAVLQEQGVFADNVHFINDDTVVIVEVHNVRVYDVTTGELLWSRETDDWFVTADVNITPNGYLVFADSELMIHVVDGLSGDEIASYPLDFQTDDYSFVSLDGMELSPSGDQLAFSGWYDLNEGFIGCMDLLTGDYVISDTIDAELYALGWADDGHIVVAYKDLYDVSSSRWYDEYVYFPNASIVSCYDTDMNRIWENEVVTDGVDSNIGFLNLSVRDWIGYVSGNHIFAYDIETGNVECNWCAADNIIHVSDRNADGWPLVITRSGGWGQPNGMDPNMGLNVLMAFPEELEEAQVNNGAYLRQENSDTILYFQQNVRDEQWQDIDYLGCNLLGSYYTCDNALAILTGDFGDTYIMLIDPSEGEIINDHIPLGTDVNSASDYMFIGSDDENIYLMTTGFSEGSDLIAVDIQSGDISTTHLTDEYAELPYSASYSNGYVTYVDGGVSNREIKVYDISRGRVVEDELYIGEAEFYIAPVYVDELGIVYAGTTDGDRLFDVETGDYDRIDLPDDWMGTQFAEPDPEGEQIIVSDGHQVLMVDRYGEISNVLYPDGHSVIGLGVLRDESLEQAVIAVVLHDGSIYRYDASTGEFIGKNEISGYTNHETEATLVPDYENGYVYIEMDRLTDVVSLDSWYEVSYVENSLGHHIPSDRFYSLQYSNSGDLMVGYYDHYTLEDLIERADELLGGIPMPDSIRTSYGL